MESFHLILIKLFSGSGRGMRNVHIDKTILVMEMVKITTSDGVLYTGNCKIFESGNIGLH